MSFYSLGLTHPKPQGFKRQIVVTGTTGSVVPLSSRPFRVKYAELNGFKDYATENTDDVWIGQSSGVGEQSIDIAPTGKYELIEADLSNWYLSVESDGDGLIIEVWS